MSNFHLDELSQQFIEFTKSKTSAQEIQVLEVVQDLWSGYGKILRLQSNSSDGRTFIAKHIRPAAVLKSHPRGWDTDLSNARKIRSYQVERNWFNYFSSSCNSMARVPQCYGIDSNEQGDVWILLEDLDPAGYPDRKNYLSFNEMRPCIRWLAHFHATFMGVKPDGLWETGTYWHLDTRPDELEILADKKLKQAASWIDTKLKESGYQTFVHGDAKVANFCFSKDGKSVAAVDFQYVGGGCGMKDLAYFVGSCLDEDRCEALEAEILNYYFGELGNALQSQQSTFNVSQVEADWRPLYHFAWADFHRFLKGWSPGHWKINTYSERVVREVLSLQN